MDLLEMATIMTEYRLTSVHKDNRRVELHYDNGIEAKIIVLESAHEIIIREGTI